MSGCRVRFAAIAAAGLGVVSFAPGAHANIKICQGIEQSYEQIARGASTVEINELLFKATDKGCQGLARRLLEAGASLEARDRFGAKPLSHAAASGQIELAALFLDHGAPIDARNLDGSTALFKAAESGRLEIVKLLVERGASVDLPGRSGVAPLSAAAFMGSAPIVEFLIEKGADPNWMDGTQKTAIVYAVGRAFPAVCTVLLAHGVDVNGLGARHDVSREAFVTGHVLARHDDDVTRRRPDDPRRAGPRSGEPVDQARLARAGRSEHEDHQGRVEAARAGEDMPSDMVPEL